MGNPWSLPIFRAGQSIVIEIEVRDITSFLPDGEFSNVLMDTTGGVEITITGSKGEVTATTSAAMTRVSTGVYRHTHPSATIDPEGLYQMELVARNGATTGRSQFYGVFRLVDRKSVV